jgi:hypothetical protein
MSSSRPCTLSRPSSSFSTRSCSSIALSVMWDWVHWNSCFFAFRSSSTVMDPLCGFTFLAFWINRLTYGSVLRIFENVEQVSSRWEKMGFSSSYFVATLTWTLGSLETFVESSGMELACSSLKVDLTWDVDLFFDFFGGLDSTSYPASYLWERPWLALVTWLYKNRLDKGGGQSIKLHASTKNVALQSQGVDQSDLNYIPSFLRYMVRNAC